MNDFLHQTMNDFCTFNKNQIIFEIDYVKSIVDRSIKMRSDECRIDQLELNKTLFHCK